MNRPLAAIVWLCGCFVLALPAVGALALEVKFQVDDGSESDPSEGLWVPALDVPLAAPSLAGLPIGLAPPESAPPPSGPETSVQESADAAGRPATVPALSPETRRAATAATAVTSLALLAGLAAYHWATIQSALVGLIVPLFSRIQSNHVLDNEVRNRIFDAIAQNPGITIKEVTVLCGVGWGTAVYHLKRLESERLVVSERNRQFRRFFKNGGRIVNESKTAFGELKTPLGQRIAETILVAPGSCQKEVCERVGISAPLAHKYLARLLGAGLVEAHREWKTVKYFPTPQLADLFPVAKAPTVAARLATVAEPLPAPLVVAA